MDPQLTLFLGPMFSGKTNTLHSECNKLSHKPGRRIAMIYYEKDKRYDLKKSHDGMLPPNAAAIYDVKCLTLEFAEELIQKKINIVGIDEVQFLPGLREFILKLHENNIEVLMSGLNCSFKGDPWPQIASILPFVRIQQFTSHCYVQNCDSMAANFSKKISDSEELEDIGGSEKYVAACYKHFNLPYIEQEKIEQEQ